MNYNSLPKGIGFEFPPDMSGEWDGFNDSGIEHFSGNPFEHLGREVPQNTIDAQAMSPARIRISLLSVQTKSVPGIDELKQAMERCLVASKGESEKAQTFFSNALKLLSGPRLPVLQIADYNTTGVVGPCENGKPFFAMMKAKGQSKKSGTAAGSYGIGKFAPFTVSGLRTVFLTTVWQDNLGKMHHYVQGKSILMSHLDDNDATRRGTGFWGRRQNCMPIEDSEAVPKWLRRVGKDESLLDQTGTTLSILGFAAKKHWQKTLAANIAENFFGAVHDGHLEVEIDDGPTVRRDTLHSIFHDPEIRASILEQKGEPEKFVNVSSYLRALIDETEVITEETQNLHLGKCQLKILVGEKLPKKVAVLRNGMLITDELPGLKRFGSYKEFVCVLECRSEKGLRLLRAMEPPRHDDFEPDRLSPEHRQAGRTALREIGQWVRQMLDRHAKDPVNEITTLDELADFFGDEEEAGAGKKKDENPTGTIIFRARAVKTKARTAAYGTTDSVRVETDEDESEDDDGSETPGGRTRDSEGPTGGSETPKGDGTGGIDMGAIGDRATRTATSGTPLQDVRAVPLEPNRRRVAFTPNLTGLVTVELQDSGADTNYLLNVAGANIGHVKDGRIAGLEVVAGKRVVIDVELDRDFNGTLRVVANAV